MNSIEAKIRNNKTKGELNSLRSKGVVPGIVYGGKQQNQKVEKYFLHKILKNHVSTHGSTFSCFSGFSKKPECSLVIV